MDREGATLPGEAVAAMEKLSAEISAQDQATVSQEAAS